jgi:peptide/nickel transport system ATP-binding protein
MAANIAGPAPEAAATPFDGPPAIDVRGLTVSYATDQGYRAALRDVSVRFEPGVVTGVTGESGSGKSTLALALVNGIPQPGRVDTGEARIDGVGDILALRGEALRRVRGKDIGFAFQAAQDSLNPLKTVGAQILDLGRSHGVRDLPALLREARALMEPMGLDPARVLASYQHELSGGMRQRVNLVFALALRPRVLILDEPTTALDMLSQLQVIQIVRDILRQRHLTSIVITHDLGVVAELADRVAVMYAGQVVEQGPVEAVLRRPRHPYTQGLLAAIPRLTGDVDRAQALAGSPPTLLTIPERGCVFRDRCPLRMAACDEAQPPLATLDRGRQVACWAVSRDA